MIANLRNYEPETIEFVVPDSIREKFPPVLFQGSTNVDELIKFLCEFDALKLLLRVCEERHLTSLTQTAEICLLAESIGKQSTGWYKKTVADLQRQKANGSQQVAKPES